jgi:transketolase
MTPYEKKMEKLEKNLDSDFKMEIQKMNQDKAKNLVVELSQQVQAIDSAKAEDDKLNALKEQVKDLAGGYRDARKLPATKLQYVLAIMKENGLESGK